MPHFIFCTAHSQYTNGKQAAWGHSPQLWKALILELRIYHISPLWCQCLSWWAHVSGSGSSQGEFTNNWCGGLIKPRHFSGHQWSWLSTFSPLCASCVNYERPLWAHACSIDVLFTEPSCDIHSSLHGEDRVLQIMTTVVLKLAHAQYVTGWARDAGSFLSACGSNSINSFPSEKKELLLWWLPLNLRSP